MLNRITPNLVTDDRPTANSVTQERIRALATKFRQDRASATKFRAALSSLSTNVVAVTEEPLCPGDTWQVQPPHGVRVIASTTVVERGVEVPGFQKRNLAEPDELTTFERGEARIVQLGELSFGRTILEPGWHWAEHIGPIVGTPTCQFPHFMVFISGLMRVVMDDGTVHDLGPGDVVDIPPGHDGWVVGDEPVVAYDIAGIRGWGKPPSSGDRMLTTLLFTDIVDSTPLAERLGDARWKELLALYYQTTRLHLDRFRGHQIATTGDGILASFDSPARAIRCAQALIGAAGVQDLRIRVGIHTGEVEWAAGNLRGLAVHIASRTMALAGPGEVLVTATSRQLASGSGLVFEDRGEHQLKGVAEPWRLFAMMQ